MKSENCITRYALLLGTICLCVSIFIIIVLLSPISLVLFLFFKMVSFFVYKIGKFIHGQNVFRPSGLDIVVGHDSDLSKQYINIILRSVGKNAPVEEVWKYFEKVLIHDETNKSSNNLKKWTSILSKFLGYYIWKKSPVVDMKNHIKLIPVSDIEDSTCVAMKELEPTDNGTGKEFKYTWEEIATLMMKKFGSEDIKGIPKWQFLICHDTEESSVCLFKIHHSITDGMNFSNLVAKGFADEEVETSARTGRTSRNSRPSFSQVIKALTVLPQGLLKLFSNKDRNTFHGPRLSGKKNFILSEPLDLDVVKDIKNAADVTVNDILFSCVAKSLSRHFEIRNENTKSVTCLLALASKRKEGSVKMKNNFLVTTVRLPTMALNDESQKENVMQYISRSYPHLVNMSAEKTSSILRLIMMKENLDEAKKDSSFLMLGLLVTFLSNLLPAFISKWLLSADGITLDISNIQGPHSTEWRFMGFNIEQAAFFLADNDPLGLAVGILSYKGSFRFALTVDDALMKYEEGQEFVNFIIEEIHSLNENIGYLQAMKTNKTSSFDYSLLDIP